jgi:hypothetical protein
VTPRHLAGRRPRARSLRQVLSPLGSRVALVVLGAVVAGMAVLGLARAAEPLELQVFTSETYFSPNGDGQEDVVSVSYCLSRPANVDIFVADDSGNQVRTIESGVSHQGSCAGPAQHFEWDGRDDAGQAVPDGVYAAHLRGRTSDAESGDVTVRLGSTAGPRVRSPPRPRGRRSRARWTGRSPRPAGSIWTGCR